MESSSIIYLFVGILCTLFVGCVGICLLKKQLAINKKEKKDRLTFVIELHNGMRVNTPMGNGTVVSIGNDIHCFVCVVIDDGNVERSFSLKDLYYAI